MRAGAISAGIVGIASVSRWFLVFCPPVDYAAIGPALTADRGIHGLASLRPEKRKSPRQHHLDGCLELSFNSSVSSRSKSSQFLPSSGLFLRVANSRPGLLCANLVPELARAAPLFAPTENGGSRSVLQGRERRNQQEVGLWSVTFSSPHTGVYDNFAPR
jgi:hypothetical protein